MLHEGPPVSIINQLMLKYYIYIINLVNLNVISSIWVKVQTPLRIADVALKRSLVA